MIITCTISSVPKKDATCKIVHPDGPLRFTKDLSFLSIRATSALLFERIATYIDDNFP